MLTRIVTGLFVLVVGFAILGAQVKKVPPSQTSPASGKDMFMNYCAVCHGKDAKGGGPAAAALKKPPADLTTLAARHGGKFPELHVAETIRGDGSNPAHGSKEMPVWGDVFQSMSRDSGAGMQMRVANLTAYIKSVQAK
jgi:mono/diheme cytochrome c family protein